MASNQKLTDADIVVIGAGVMGAAIAYHLVCKTDKKVLLIDRAHPLSGMSGRTFGQVRRHYSNTLMLQMAQHGFDYFQNWKSRVGQGDAGYVPLGYLLLVKEEQLALLHRNIKFAQSLGINTRYVEPDEVAKMEPAINPNGLSGAAYDPAGGYIDVAKITLNWLGAGREKGLSFLANAEVSALETTNGQISAVVTSKGRIAANHVVCAAGAWSKNICASVDVDIPIDARRIDTMYLKAKPGRLGINACITDGNSNIAIRPDMGPVFLAGAYAGDLPEMDDLDDAGTKESDALHLQRIRSALKERIPSLADATPMRSSNGAYDITPDWHPLIGPAPPIHGLYVAAGFSGHGLKIAPSVGDGVSDMVLERKPKIDLTPLRLNRFPQNDPMFLAYGPGARA